MDRNRRHTSLQVSTIQHNHKIDSKTQTSFLLFRCIARLLLLYRHNETIIQTPPIPQLQRQMLAISSDNSVMESAQNQMGTVSFTLKRSGRVMRKADSSPPVSMRTWKPMIESENEQDVEKALVGRQLAAEVLYVAKPLVHLGAMGCFGEKAWKPWLISLAMDLARYKLVNIYRWNV